MVNFFLGTSRNALCRRECRMQTQMSYAKASVRRNRCRVHNVRREEEGKEMLPVRIVQGSGARKDIR